MKDERLRSKEWKKYIFPLDKLYSVCYTYNMPGEQSFGKVREMLGEKGYTLVRISGSHHIFKKPGETLLSIPVHKGKVKPYYVRQIEKI